MASPPTAVALTPTADPRQHEDLLSGKMVVDDGGPTGPGGGVVSEAFSVSAKQLGYSGFTPAPPPSDWVGPDDAAAATLQAQLFPPNARNEPTSFDPQQWTPMKIEIDEQVPHGTHPTTPQILSYRDRHALNIGTEQPAQQQQQQQQQQLAQQPSEAKWGLWASMPPYRVASRRNEHWKEHTIQLNQPHVDFIRQTFERFPPAYIDCILQVDRPFEVLCGHRQPSDEEERRLVCDAVEAMFVEFIELMLVIQLRYLELQNDYKLLTKDSIHRHAACAMLGKRPTDQLTSADFKLFNDKFRRKVAPFDAALQTYDRPSLLQFFERELGTLYVFGVPVMSTRVSRTEPGWRHANKFLELVGSKLRLRLCVLGSSTELLLGEPLLPLCTAEVVVVGRERARTAMLAFEVASTQDTAENPVKMFRTESTAFIVHHKWDVGRITSREWNRQTYGPTQKLVVLLTQQLLGGNADKVRELLHNHCTDSLMEYQTGEQMVNAYTFTPVLRGILHALFSKHVPLEDMHSWLVDTVDRPTRHGILQSILRSRHQEPQKARIRMLMYTTDTWFSGNRLYTVLMVGTMAAAVHPNLVDLDFDLLAELLPRLYILTTKSLVTMAEKAYQRFTSAQYRVLSHVLNFDSISSILKRQYQRNDGFLDESSLRFNSSFWMNILGYYVRLNNGVDVFDAEILSLVHTFLDDVIEVLSESSPALAQQIAAHPPVVSDGPLAAQLRERLVHYFELFSHIWDTFVRSCFHSNVNPAVHRGRHLAEKQQLHHHEQQQSPHPQPEDEGRAMDTDGPQDEPSDFREAVDEPLAKKQCSPDNGDGG